MSDELGVGLGTAVYALLSQLLRANVFGLSAVDSTVVASVCGVLFGAGCAALYMPARWASALDPATVLRSE